MDNNNMIRSDLAAAKAAREASNRSKNTATQNRVANSSATQGLSFYGNNDTVNGQVTGLERANQLFGMNTAEIGNNISDIAERRRLAMEGNDPASTMARSTRNADIRSAQAQGMTPAQVAQLKRSGSMDAAAQDYASQDAATGAFQDMMGNIAGGTMSSEQAYAQLSNAQNQDTGGGTVICTELYRQGFMDEETYKKDADYGRLVRSTRPNAYTGYIFLASPIVAKMKESYLITKLVSVPALCWARDMAGDKNLIGKLINTVGLVVCDIVGSIIKKEEVVNG